MVNMECVYVDYCGVMVFVSVGRICVYMCMRVCVCVCGGEFCVCVNIVNYTGFFYTNGVVFDISTHCLLRRSVN